LYDFKNIKFEGKYTFNCSNSNYYYEDPKLNTEESSLDASSRPEFNVYNNKIKTDLLTYTDWYDEESCISYRVLG
jgi:hypothetical protein